MCVVCSGSPTCCVAHACTHVAYVLKGDYNTIVDVVIEMRQLEPGMGIVRVKRVVRKAVYLASAGGNL